MPKRSMIPEKGKRNLIGPQVRQLRKKKELSQQKLANAFQLRGFDCDRGTINNIEHRNRLLSDV